MEIDRIEVEEQREMEDLKKKDFLFGDGMDLEF